jgi:hypothetical protein
VTKRVCRYCSDAVKCAGLCSAHYQYVWFWTQKKGVKAMMEHGEKLDLRASIIHSIGGTKATTPSNVISLTTHPRFVPKKVTKRKTRVRLNKERRAAAG